MDNIYIKLLDIRKDFDLLSEFLRNNENSTLFHDPSFLMYHSSNKFKEHNLGFFKGNQLQAFIPFALLESAKQNVALSPYGASFGGFVCKDDVSFLEIHSYLQLLIDYFKQFNISKITLTFPPRNYFKTQNIIDNINSGLAQVGFLLESEYITSIVDFRNMELMDLFHSSARRKYVNAQNSKISMKIVENKDNVELGIFYKMLEDTLKIHNASPTHTFEELVYLFDKCQDRIKLFLAKKDSNYLAGIVLFLVTPSTALAFYNARNLEENDPNSLTFLFAETIEWLKARNYSFLDLGTTQKIGVPLNKGLFQFKDSLGSTSVLREKWTIEI
ncbi:hypothetical protein ACH434_08580 [Lysinibacillus fusiformis]|uniref:hypothetical protein n=1 Tax=Lysinibacillus fusiformis TaxID=28031 RepID=UPI0037966CF7